MFFFLPTGSSAERTHRPVVTLSIGALCVAIFCWTTFVQPPQPELLDAGEAEAFARAHPYLTDDDSAGASPEPEVLAEERRTFDALLEADLDRYGGSERALSLVPRRGFAQPGWVTNLFVHFGFLHLAGNLLFLWLVGPLLEEAWGRRRFAAFYLAAGLVASLVQFLLSRHEMVSIGGASGAIAGCMGAFAVRFAATKIKLLYFVWFLRLFYGSVWIPAWLCGVLWFVREAVDLKDGGATGVATGAHVGGFVLGAVVAFAIKGLGLERATLTVAEAGEAQARRDLLFLEATRASARGDLENAREALEALQREVAEYPGAALLAAELEVRSGRGQARLERVLRSLLSQGNIREAQLILQRLWPVIDPRGFTSALAWQLAERLSTLAKADPRMISALVEAVAAGTGTLSVKARALLTQEGEHVAAARASVPPEGFDRPGRRSAPTRQVASSPPVRPSPPRIAEAMVVGVSPRGLELAVQGGASRVLPFESVSAVHAGLVPSAEGRMLVVDVVLRSPTPAALRLRGADPTVPRLYPDRPVPAAWQAFLSGLRRAAGLSEAKPPWEEHSSVEALVARWSAPPS